MSKKFQRIVFCCAVLVFNPSFINLYGSELNINDGRRSHWSFQPVKKISTHPEKVSIDKLIQKAISQKGLAIAKQAKPKELIRRLYIDLIGLPPDPEQVQNFTKNPSKEQYEKIVEEMLNSPQFGANWARMWLDMARYSETAGGGCSYPTPLAWRYRSFVIDSYNKDMPYNQFLKKQIAGDLLASQSNSEKTENLIATGFLTIGAKPLDLQNKVQLLLDHVDEQLDTIGRMIMGISIGCARCHDHSYDPVSQKDYSRMAAIFQNTKAIDLHNISFFTYRPLPGVNITQAYESIGHFLTSRALKREIADLEKKINDGQKGLNSLKAQKDKELAKLVYENSRLPVALAVEDYKKFSKGFIRLNGTEKKSTEVERGGPLEFIPSHLAKPVPKSQSGRLQFANWLTDPKHPLTARVYVNRIWARLFDKGIVKSLDNFGVTGQKPTHPELLDFLTVNFLKSGWSTKKLIRKIVLSNAYKRSIEPAGKFKELDPANDLLSFFPRRRMNAEAIRDSILSVSGNLNSTHLKGVVPNEQLQSSNQRSIFLPIMRDEGKNFLLDAFDFPDPAASTGERNVTNHPKQSLFLMNSPFILRQSYKAASRLLNDCQGKSKEEKFYRAAMLTYSREFSDAEKEIFQELLSQTLDEKAAWARIFHLIFCSVDFRFLK